MPEERDCVVKLVDDHGVEHSVKVCPESVYEAALKGLERLDRVGWESDGTQIGWVVVEVGEEPCRSSCRCCENLHWLEKPGRFSRNVCREEELRGLIKS